MELYKWYRGSELPDRECDCVVVYRYKFLANNTYTPNYHTLGKYTENFFVDSMGRILTVVMSTMVGEIVSWMPIEFPKEVE